MLRRKVERFLQTRGVPAGASLLIGYSGGPDSTCLVSLLSEIAPQKQYRLACAYLDHGLRPPDERRAEAEQVMLFCRDRGLRLFTRSLQEGTLEAAARSRGLSLEEAARLARIDFFRSLRTEQAFAYLLLGHTLDDQLETVLYRIFQGSGPGGLRGIRARAGWILRPLLSVARRDILGYLAEREIAFITDTTNNQDRFLRNRVRHRIVPALQEVFPGLGRSLAALRLKNALIDDFVQKTASQAIIWSRTPRGVKTGITAFRRAAPALRLYALYEATGMIDQENGSSGKRSIPFRFLKPLLVASGTWPRNINLLGHGVAIRLRGTSLFLERHIVAIGKKGYFIPINPGIPVTLPDCQLVLRLPDAETTRTEALICVFDAEKVTFPIVVRSRRPGDRIDLGFGTKKLKKLFNELKIDKTERETVPVIEDAAGVLAVLGRLAGVRNVVRYGAAADGRTGTNRTLTLHMLPAASRERRTNI